jgi:hypothetical protein
MRRLLSNIAMRFPRMPMTEFSMISILADIVSTVPPSIAISNFSVSVIAALSCHAFESAADVNTAFLSGDWINEILRKTTTEKQ